MVDGRLCAARVCSVGPVPRRRRGAGRVGCRSRTKQRRKHAAASTARSGKDSVGALALACDRFSSGAGGIRRLKATGRPPSTPAMSPERLMREGTPAEVSVLAVMAVVLGAGCLLGAAFPLADDAPRGVLVGFGLTAVAVALALVLVGPKVTAVYLHLTVLL